MALMAYAMAALATEIAGLIFWAAKVRHNPELRKKLKDSAFFWTQFWLHPVVVAGSVFLAGRAENPLWALMLAPFCFSFGVEPWDLPDSNLFMAFFYAHHIAPLLACVEVAAFGGGDTRGALATALLFGHVWALHPIGRLKMKQQLFWPYVIEGAAVIAYWGHVSLRPHPTSLAPVAVQMVGRWGLYLYIMKLCGWPKPGDKYYDAFDRNKIPVEMASVLASVVVAYLGYCASHSSK